MILKYVTAFPSYAVLHRWKGGGGRGEGLGVLEHPQLSRSKYFDRAVTLIQQSAQNSYSLLIVQYSKNYTIFGLKCPQIQSPDSNFKAP